MPFSFSILGNATVLLLLGVGVVNGIRWVIGKMHKR